MSESGVKGGGGKKPEDKNGRDQQCTIGMVNVHLGIVMQGNRSW